MGPKIISKGLNIYKAVAFPSSFALKKHLTKIVKVIFFVFVIIILLKLPCIRLPCYKSCQRYINLK